MPKAMKVIMLPAKPGERECGPCTLCCKVMRIPEMPDRLSNEYCPHAKKAKGCSIYRTRPQSCRDFECAWLMYPNVFTDDMRPDKIHVMARVEPLTDGSGRSALLLDVDIGWPKAYKENSRLVAIINRWQGPVFAMIGPDSRRALNQEALDGVKAGRFEMPTER